jgi:hypothetical protein
LLAAGDIALTGLGGQLHVERRAVVQVADDEVAVHHLDVARRGDLAGGDLAGAGGRQLQPLGAFAFHAQSDLLHVEHDVGHVLAHAREAREFVQHALDLDRGDGGALQRGQEHAAQRVAERQAEAPLQRLGHERRLATRIAAAGGFFSSALGFFISCQFFALTAMVFPWALETPNAPPNFYLLLRLQLGQSTTLAETARRGGAWTGARRCAGSASRRGST